MDLFAPIDIYCERTDASYWAEPINALSNLSFVFAALWALWVLHSITKQTGEATRDWLILIAIALAGLIGVGSFLFHTHATVWSSLADVIPIWTFVAYYIFLAIYRIVGTSLWRAVRIFSIAIGVTFASLWLASEALLAADMNAAGGDGLNGSTQYLPGMIALLVFSIALVITRHPARGWILSAALIFCLSIFFRTIDMMVCSDFPLGVHFLWHLLNGLFVGLLLQALVRHGRRTPSP